MRNAPPYRFSVVFVGFQSLLPFLSDMINLYYQHLLTLGYDVTFENNILKADRINLVFGSHLLEPGELDFIAFNFDYIIMQFEQLSPHNGWAQIQAADMPRFMRFFRSALVVWDFSVHNQAFLAQHDIASRYLNLGYHPALATIPAAPTKDIDVLFYGSFCERRENLVQLLLAECKLVTIKKRPQAVRDGLIARSKIVLNLHYFEDLTVLEQARVFYLLSNQVFVISETSLDNPYGDALVSYDYDALVAGVLSWLDRPESERLAQARRGQAAVQAIPFQEQLQAAIAALPEQVKPQD